MDHIAMDYLAADAPNVQPPSGVFGGLAHAAEWFIGLFQEGATFLVALITGIIPLLIVLLTAVNALVRGIGP
jgi:PTS system glucitol/sorbitol-specific IIC component